MQDLVEVTEAGLYCRQGDCFVDPWRPVPRAIITHAHADHARRGCGRYLCAAPGKLVLRSRMGGQAPIDVVRHGESILINGVRVSLHPAGHVLGSAQVRLEHGGTTWVVTGDYKLERDPTGAPCEPCRCDVCELRARPLRRARHGVDVRAPRLPLALVGGDRRGPRPVVARQS
jgi:putative mRNA 3-end processing factor